MSEALPTVRYIEKEEVLQWIKREGVRGYRYRPNIPGSWFLIICGVISLAIAAVLANHSGLVLLIHKLGFAVLAGFTLWAFWLVGHWMLFTARNYIGVSDDELLVGRGSRAYVIPRSRLTRETVRVDAMQRGKLTHVLPIEVGTYKKDIHLFGPFANLQNLQQFIADVLESLLLEEDEDE